MASQKNLSNILKRINTIFPQSLPENQSMVGRIVALEPVMMLNLHSKKNFFLLMMLRWGLYLGLFM